MINLKSIKKKEKVLENSSNVDVHQYYRSFQLAIINLEYNRLVAKISNHKP